MFFFDVLKILSADAAEKFKQASLRMSHIEDPRNAEYLQVHILKSTPASKLTMKNQYSTDF